MKKAIELALKTWYSKNPKEWKPTFYVNNKPKLFIRKLQDIGLDSNQIISVLDAMMKVTWDTGFSDITNAQDINVNNSKFIEVVSIITGICSMCHDGEAGKCGCMRRENK